MKVLFIGGTGIISSASVKLAFQSGINISIFSRGKSETIRAVPDGVGRYYGDVNDEAKMKKFFNANKFDVVVNWVAYSPEQIKRDIRLFKDNISQYIFISSASAYQKPVKNLPITESTILHNPYWEYSRNKQACEEVLVEEYQSSKFPFTIIRPSHTYDKTLFPFRGGYTVARRIIEGKPVIIHGDGTSLWVLTNHRDFAKGFVPLLGNENAIGEIYQITSDEILSWNQIFETIAEGYGKKLNAIYVPSTKIAKYDASWGESLIGDKMHSVLFDNSKIKSLVPNFDTFIPYSLGSKETINWYEEDKSRQIVDENFSTLLDQIARDYR